MGKSSRRKKEARIFREEDAVSKDQWNESIRRLKSNVSYDTPVIRYKWKIKNKYPKTEVPA